MLRLSHHYCGQAYPSKGLSQNPSPSRLPASSPIGPPDFREAPELATGFPRMSLLGSSVNRGKRKGRSPCTTYLGLPATVEATRVVASSSVICSTNFLVAILVRNESSSYLLLLLLLLLWPLFLREQDVVNRDVHFRDPKAGQVLHPVYHVVAHGLADLRDLPAVLHGHREICGGLLRANLDGDAAGLAPTTDARHAARHAV